jgi:hypothetical protein
MENIKLSGSTIGINQSTNQSTNQPPLLEYENVPVTTKKARGRPKKNTNDFTNKNTDDFTKNVDDFTKNVDDNFTKKNTVDFTKKNVDDNFTKKNTDDPVEDDEMKKTKLIRKITQYKNLFIDETKGISINNLEKLSQEKLEIKLKKIQSIVESRKSQSSTRGIFLVGLNTIEQCDSYIGLQLQGLTNCASKSEDILLTVDEISIKYFDTMMQTDPIIRLCIGLGHLVLAVDTANRQKSQFKNIKTQSNDNDLSTIPEEYKTL